MRLRRIVLLTFALLFITVFYPASSVLASHSQAPKYPNLEPFTIESNEEGYYTEMGGDLIPSFHFPELKNLDAYTMHQYGPLTTTGGSFIISGETGPEGNITGSFSYSGYAERPWSDGEVDTYTIKAEGKITNGKAAYDDKGFLRILGAAHYQRKFEFSGPVTLTLTYDAIGRDENGDDTRFSGTATAQAQIAFLSCISDEETINLCYIETGTGYGDYGFSANFVNKKSEDFVWFNNLDFEFQQIKGINFDPEAHHKLTQQPGEEEQEQESPLLDESYLNELEEAEEILDNAEAGFFINMYCDNEIYPEDGITCNLNIMGGTESQPYTVNWIVNGYVIKTSTVLLNADNFIFPNPPPGFHGVQVQVIDQATYNARVSAANVEVLVPEDAEKIKPWTQAMAGAGSVAILGAWLWSEWAAAKAKHDWFEQWYEKANKKSRDAWFEKQMAINDEYKKFREEYQEKLQEKIAAHNKACEKESKRFKKELIKIINKNKNQVNININISNNDDLLDLYDELISNDVKRDGIWDAKQLLRAEEVINILLQRRLENELNHQMDFLNKRQKAFTDLTYSWTAGGIELVAGVLTGGASELVFIPTRAIGNALYAKKRAELLGKTGWDAAKHVMIEAGSRLAVEALFIEGFQWAVPKVLSAGGKVIKGIGKRILKPSTIKQIGEWWAKNSQRFVQAPKTNPKLPIIKNHWGKGTKVFVNKPTASWVNPKPLPRVDFGMDNYLNNKIRPISTQLADDMGHLFREGININPKVNNLLKVTDKIMLNHSDDVALKLVNNSAYKTAVEQGLVPASVQQSVYQARDKLCKRAIQETFEKLDGVMLGGKTASSYIESIAITGTGAKPLSPQAIGRFTDFDSTVIGKSESELAIKAEKLFADTFHDRVATRINAKTAEVKMFPGIHTGELSSHTGGYISEPMIQWTKVDLINRGRSVVRLDNSTIMFDAHPDVAPLNNFGPYNSLRYPSGPGMAESAFADAHSVVTNDVVKALRESGGSLTNEQVLIKHGKQAYRAWVATNAGKGLKMPPEIRRLAELKTNPGTRLNPNEIPQLWKYFTDFLDLPSNLGARV